MTETGIPQESPRVLSPPALLPHRQQHPLRFIVACLLAVVAMLALAAAPAAAQSLDDRVGELEKRVGGIKPRIRGNVGFLYGQWSVSAPNNDSTREDIDGPVASTESNIFFEGGDEVMDYRLRFRFRGRDRPEGDFSADGQAGSFASGSLQTVRGHVRWHVGDVFSIRIAAAGTHPTASLTELDPVQNLPFAGRLGETSDEPFIDFQWRVSGSMFGFLLSPSPGTSMQTNGLPASGPGAGGGENAAGASGQTMLGGYYQYKSGGFLISGYFATASADADTNLDGTTDFDGSSTAIQGHLAIPLGGSASLKFDLETVSNDLEPTLNGGVTEEEQMFAGVLLNAGMVNVGWSSGTQEIGTLERTQTNLSGDIRFQVSKQAWVGPQLQLQTREVTGAADEEITSLAFMMNQTF